MSDVSWRPLSALRIITPKLTLRLPSEQELQRLADQAVGKVLEPEQAAFLGPWSQLPAPEFQRGMLQYHAQLRRDFTPAAWRLEFGVYPAGEHQPVGMMAVAVDEATETRTAMTGSWLLPQWRGQGLGKEARQAVLHLLFAELGLDAAWSGVHPDNGPSMGVSRALGYEPDGEFPFSSGAGTVTSIRLTLRRERWERQRRDDIRVEGLDRCRDLLGL